MQVQVFEGSRKKKYRYVEVFYAVHGRKGTLRCFVTDQYAWFNEVKGLTEYASSQLTEGMIIDPSSPCSHDTGKKEIALILGPMRLPSCVIGILKTNLLAIYYLSHIRQKMAQAMCFRVFSLNT